MKEGEGRKAKEGRRWKKEAKISMKEGREEGERRKDINEGRKEGNMPETRVPTQYFREDAPDAKEGKKGRERMEGKEERKRNGGRKRRRELRKGNEERKEGTTIHTHTLLYMYVLI